MKNAVHEWLDTIGRADLAAAQQVQRAIDASYGGLKLPIGEAREISVHDLMPLERRAFGWADTEPAQ